MKPALSIVKQDHKAQEQDQHLKIQDQDHIILKTKTSCHGFEFKHNFASQYVILKYRWKQLVYFCTIHRNAPQKVYGIKVCNLWSFEKFVQVTSTQTKWTVSNWHMNKVSLQEHEYLVVYYRWKLNSVINIKRVVHKNILNLHRNCHMSQHNLRSQRPARYRHRDGFQQPRHLWHCHQLPCLHLPTSSPARLPPLSCHTRDDVPYRAERLRCLQDCLHWDREVKTAQQHRVLSRRWPGASAIFDIQLNCVSVTFTMKSIHSFCNTCSSIFEKGPLLQIMSASGQHIGKVHKQCTSNPLHPAARHAKVKDSICCIQWY